MSFNYKNPISPITSLGNVSVSRDQTFGTNYSVLGTGGFMEVFNLSDLDYIIPSGFTGLIEFTGNTIPIQFNKGLGTTFSPDVLTLHSDNISSGRRKLGMLVYVYETNKIYQHTIDDYDLLWTAATSSSGPGGPTVVISEFGTTVKNNSVAGQNLINAWTASTIEGISGYTNLNATWRVLQNGGGEFTGGTVTGDTIFTQGVTATTFSAVTYLGLPADIFITGGTFDNTTDTLILERNIGSTILITGVTDYYTTAFTYSDNTFTIYDNSGNTFPVTVNDFTGLTINGSLSATTISGDGSGLTNLIYTGGTISGNTVILAGLTADTISATTYLGLPIDVYVTGGTYSAGTATFTNITGGTFDVVGFYTGETDDNIFVTAFTYSSNTLTIFDNSGSTFPVTINDFTGLTINGDLSANTISATTYLNLPIDPDTYITGFTYSSNTFTISDNSGSTFSTTIDFVTGLTATTLSATTYLGLPTDFNTYITGFTYDSNTFTLTDNSGSTLNAFFDTVTGFTINGDLTVTGSSTLNGTITSGSLSGTTDRMVQVDSGGTLTAVTDIITAYISSASTQASLLSTTSNWDINGVYTGTTITGTFQGQRYYDNDYFYEAVEDNLFIRLIRG